MRITMWGAQEVMDPETRKMYVEYVLKCHWKAGDSEVRPLGRRLCPTRARSG